MKNRTLFRAFHGQDTKRGTGQAVPNAASAGSLPRREDCLCHERAPGGKSQKMRVTPTKFGFIQFEIGYGSAGISCRFRGFTATSDIFAYIAMLCYYIIILPKNQPLKQKQFRTFCKLLPIFRKSPGGAPKKRALSLLSADNGAHLWSGRPHFFCADGEGCAFLSPRKKRTAAKMRRKQKGKGRYKQC